MKFFIWSILIIVSSSVAGLIIIVIGHDPYTAGKLVKFLFFSSLLLSLSGLFLILKLVVKKIFKK
ncbi:MAG: hypothetical protein A2651_03500 [Candidatus Yanofskybacteria bacterium RIFCSPHIGHO2_01_FULL_42_12]|uniref:Uncharacterized protein n=1 Tax=Candidatus Yanofskybacteria bacterium RIFCSPLOWO2_01_FULL_42_49 TaxID=1802694 RepID=A0A1F8GBY5_9BACT|nr:MAG: hypothetical protein A2651_03500 [Candidatus Yanofskybacteria bacterium RIFCSPHIGHO2_01_FULL_42_12]OGN22550.1 MAG: hypothetical protein A2918_02195 [Candidatus Yanofskybacteria bacterium RIFCSPLOWO2_01_FULL_42_49]